MKTALIFYILMIAMVCAGNSQTLSSSVVSTAGGFYEQTGSSLSVTAGETMIAYHATDTYKLGAGFQQSYGAMLRQLLVSVLIEGPFDGLGMSNTLNSNSLLPLNQPYNISPWNYTGTESVTNMPVAAVDWVLVELRDADSPQNADETTTLAGWPKALFLDDEGNILDLNGAPKQFSNTAQNNLYIVIRHRNHLDVLSNGPLVLAGNTYTYDFTDAITKAFGGALGYKQIASGLFGMVAGDSDADGEVSVLDFSTWASQFGGTGVYSKADNDMDGEVSVLDFSKWAINFGSGNPVSKPEDQIIYRSQVPDKK